MSAIAPLIFPGGRVVAGWWRRLAPYRPLNLWISYLVVQRVEVLTRVRSSCDLDPLLRPALAVLVDRPLAQAELQRRLHFGSQLAWQVTRLLERHGLSVRDPDGRITLTERGLASLRQRTVSVEQYERRTFVFLRSSGTHRAPVLAKLESRPRHAWPVGDDWQFDVSQLDACVRQGNDWKTHHSFPMEVVEIVPPAGPNNAARPAPDVPDRQRAFVIHAERLPAALIRTSAKNGRDEWLAFEFQQQGWHLQDNTPVLTIGEEWTELLPELVEPIPITAWRAAWQSWLESRGIVDPDIASCHLERSTTQLHIRATPALVERFRSVIRPAVQSDIWLLAGEGRFREALHVDLTAA